MASFRFGMEFEGDQLDGPGIGEIPHLNLLAPRTVTTFLFEQVRRDGDLGPADALVLQRLAGTILGITAPAVATVPEAPTSALLLMAIAGLALTRRASGSRKHASTEPLGARS
jgi:hypothetical protein